MRPVGIVCKDGASSGGFLRSNRPIIASEIAAQSLVFAGRNGIGDQLVSLVETNGRGCQQVVVENIVRDAARVEPFWHLCLPPGL